MSIDPDRDRRVHEFGKPGGGRWSRILLDGRGSSTEDMLSLLNERFLPQLADLAPQAVDNRWWSSVLC
jgi:hypothetical protein